MNNAVSSHQKSSLDVYASSISGDLFLIILLSICLKNVYDIL